MWWERAEASRRRIPAPARAAAGDLLAALVIVFAAFAPFPLAEFRPNSLFVTAVVLAPALLLPLRRRFPIPVLGGTVALYATAAVFGTMSPGAILAVALATCGVAGRLPRRVSLPVTAGTVVVVLLLTVFAEVDGVVDPRNFQFAIIVAFAGAAGDAIRSRREYIAAITERAERAERSREEEARRRVSEERLRIARDLHDTVAHQIAVISLNAGVASSSLESSDTPPPERATEALRTIRGAARTVLGEIGDLLAMLRTEDSAAAAPPAGLAQIDDLVRSFGAAGLSVTVRVQGDASRVSGAADLVAYHLVQEALTNAHKHGAEQRAHVLIDVGDDEFTVVVTNPASPPPDRDDWAGATPAGHGLLGLRERVASVRGTIDTGMAAGGYRLSATIPLTKVTTP
jgi:signal transduction histidine kinase